MTFTSAIYLTDQGCLVRERVYGTESEIVLEGPIEAEDEPLGKVRNSWENANESR